MRHLCDKAADLALCHEAVKAKVNDNSLTLFALLVKCFPGPRAATPLPTNPILGPRALLMALLLLGRPALATLTDLAALSCNVLHALLPLLFAALLADRLAGSALLHKSGPLG